MSPSVTVPAAPVAAPRQPAATADLYGVTTADLARSQLLGETLDADEVAAAVAFCCSREGRVLNGSVVAADGGFAG